MERLEQEIAQGLGQGQDLVLATILEQAGSTPRMAGSEMLVRPDGSISGTVGGGLVEHQVIQSALELMGSGGVRLINFALTGEHVESLDMICGGSLRVILESLTPGSDAQVFAALAQAFEARRPALKVTLLTPVSPGDTFAARRCLVQEDASLVGPCPLDVEALAPVVAQGRRGRPGVPQVIRLGDDLLVTEVSAPLPRLIIFGAGHVSQALAAMARMVDMAVVVIDDRPEFANARRFPDAEEVRVIESFDRSLEGLGITPSDSLAIMTRGHLHDKTTLGLCLGTPAGYLGMIGSSRKRRTIYEALLEEGFSQEDLDRVHSPIGLPIGADTPAEIAVSILAQLIQYWAERR